MDHFISRCEWCGEDYCIKCSDAPNESNNFCSAECEREHAEDLEAQKRYKSTDIN
jgi:hypothetical protein